MPPNRNSPPRSRRSSSQSEPPPVMTWMKALPVLTVSVICDALRFMFEMFWFFGPAIAAAYCAIKTSNAIVGTATICAGVAAAAGFVGGAALAVFGVVMAIAVGIAGWLIVILILLASNRRIFKENALWIFSGFLMSEMPILGAIPSMTITMWRMHHTQIVKEEAALKKFEESRAAEQMKERREQASFAQSRAIKQAQALQQSQVKQEQQVVVANDAHYAQSRAVENMQATEAITEGNIIQFPAGRRSGQQWNLPSAGNRGGGGIPVQEKKAA